MTTLGAADGDAAGAAKAVVRYLDGRAPAPGGAQPGSLPNLPTPDGTRGIVGYYADSVEGPGRWLGRGITGMRLEGQVDAEQFRRVLLGQHAVTGEQLVGPSGSAARAEQAGREGALVAPHGEPDELLSLPQAATLLGVSDRYLRRLAAETATLRDEQAKAVAAGEPPPDTPATYLVASQDGDKKHWRVTRAEVERFAADRAAPAAVVGYDLTFSVPKSVSILWARGDAAVQAQILAAIERAVAVGMAYVEEHGAWVGRGANRRPAAGVVAAGYVHATSRALDPQLHWHVVVANMAESLTGAVLALDGRALYAHAKTAGYLAAAQLRHELASSLGVEWEPVERGLADVAGVGGPAISEMSKRSEEIDELTGELGVDSLAARQAAAYATRAAKELAVDPEALRPSWHQRLDSVGFDARSAAACYGRQAAPLLVTEDDRLRLFALLGGSSGVTEMASTFDRRDVVQFVAQWAGDRLDASGISDLADQWLSTDAVVTLDAGRREGRTADVIRLGDGRVVTAVGDEALYTTRQVLDIEQRLVAGYGDGRYAGMAVVDEATVEAVLAARPKLGEDQVQMVRDITRSGHLVQCVLGPAGAGKTTALEAAVRAWESAGFVPLATAVQGTHAELLGNRTGIEARTVASLLKSANAGAITIDERSVIVLDEASTIGNRDLLALVELCRARGAALRLVGDPAQHGAVAAGGGWRYLLQEYPQDRAEVHERRRQQGEEMADVVLALTDYSEDRVSAAIERLRAGGRVVEADSPEEVLTALVADWYQDRQRRLAEPGLAVSTMTADHHSERRELNRRARALLIADGTLTGPSLDLPGVSFGVGDEVIAVQGDRSLRPWGAAYRDHVRTGERGTVAEVRLAKDLRASALVVDFERRGRVVVDHGHLTHRVRPGVVGRLAHSYAVTTYAAQGETYQAGRGLATEHAMRAGVYVALSRGISDAKLYMLRRRDLEPVGDDPHMPRLETETALIAEVTARLEAQQAEQLATEVDADAPAVARLRHTHNLAQLSARASGPATPDTARARRALADELCAIATRARVQPEPALVARLGTRPSGGADRRHWDAAVGEVATFRARWRAEPVAGGPGVTWALGPQRAGQAGDDYAAAAALLRRAQAAQLAHRPTAELTQQRSRLLAILASSVGGPLHGAPSSLDPSGMADALAAAEAARQGAAQRLERLQSAGGRRRNVQGIELATQDLDASELAVAQARVRFDETVTLQAAGAGDPDGRADAGQRLATIEAALARQASAAIESPAPYLATVLGTRPDTDRGRRLWDGAAVAVERYRHVRLGLTPTADAPPPDTMAGAAIALGPALGSRPQGEADAVAYDELLHTVQRARAALLLGALGQEASPAADRTPELRRLSRRRLPSLLAELEHSRRHSARFAVAERRVGDAGRQVDLAEAEIQRVSTAASDPSRRRGRWTATPAPAVDLAAQAQRRLDQARGVLETAEAAVAAMAAPPAGHSGALEDAVILREADLHAEVLRDPPPWLRADVARRVAAHPPDHDALSPSVLARAYGGVATYAERAGLSGASHLDDILRHEPPTEDLARYRAGVLEDLDVDVSVAVEVGVDLSL